MTKAWRISFLVVLLSLLSSCSDSDSSNSNDEIPQPEVPAGPDNPQEDELPAAYLAIVSDRLVEADYWQEEPAILSAGLGFTDINGILGLGESGQTLEEMEQLVRDYGGGWHDVTSAADDIAQRARTSSNSVFGMTETFGYTSPSGDGIPM